MKAAKRKAIGKSLRFDVFTRDGYTCRYCGRQSDTVILHVDHVIPVSKGGTNDPENLVTACADCNMGKSNKNPSGAAPNDQDRLRLSQEMNEQVVAAKAAVESVRARKEIQQQICDYWSSLTLRGSVDTKSLMTVCSFLKEFPLDDVLGWIDRAFNTCGHSDKSMGMYISGIRRCVKAEAAGKEEEQ